MVGVIVLTNDRWANQDGGPGNVGTLVKLQDGDEDWANVRWDKTGSGNVYRIHPKHDLEYTGVMSTSAAVGHGDAQYTSSE